MKHLKNRISGKLFCQVKRPHVNRNTIDIGYQFSTPEAKCVVCINYWDEYRILNSKSIAVIRKT